MKILIKNGTVSVDEVTSIENDKIRVRIQFFKDMGVKILEFKVHFKAYGLPWIIGIV